MIRDVGFLKWKDPSHWMEAMRGPRWKARMNMENNKFMKSLSDASPEEISITAKLFQAYSDESDDLSAYNVSLGTTQIRVTQESGGDFIWKWQGLDKKYPLSGDLDATNDSVVVYTEDIKNGGRHYKAVAVNRERTLWTFDGWGDHGLSSDIAILGNRVYFLEAASPLQYKWLVSVDLKDGKDRRVHYEEHDLSASLGLIMGENKCLFLLAENGGIQALYHINLRGGVKRVEKDAKIFYTVGYSKTKEVCYFFRKEFGAPWEAHGAALKALVLPREFYTSGIDLVSLRDALIVYRHHGQRFMVACKGRTRRLASFWGEVQDNPWGLWNGLKLDLRLFISGQTPVRACIDNGLHVENPRSIYGGILKHGFARSEDGTSVRWLGVWSRRAKPRALLVIGYGAYGLTTPIETTRWRPYLEQGFAVGFAFVRGGGDHNDLWAEEGRREGKERGVQDFEACIRALQEVSGVGAAKTCIYGRSAGGYLVGTTVLRNPGGRLAKCAYTEAPYVDVLQTASNVKLPLTISEYLEFGDPAHNIFDFETLLRLSPVNGLGADGAPGVFVLCRAGLNDRQVYAYESVKWMDALRRGKGEDKILFITEGVGHNLHGDLQNIERAEDFLIMLRKMVALPKVLFLTVK